MKNIAEQLKEAIGCIRHISDLRSGGKNTPAGERIATLWLKDFEEKWGEK